MLRFGVVDHAIMKHVDFHAQVAWRAYLLMKF